MEGGSLTHHIQRITGRTLHVSLLEASWQRPTVEEARLLGGVNRDQRVWIREVTLSVNGQPFVTARLVVPGTLGDWHIRRVQMTGARSVGPTLFQIAKRERVWFVEEQAHRVVRMSRFRMKGTTRVLLLQERFWVEE
jgi:chorismate--pyruvate lyase